MNQNSPQEPVPNADRPTLLTFLLTLLGCVLFVLFALQMTATAQSPSPTPTPTPTPPPEQPVPGCTPTLPPVSCTPAKECTGCSADPQCDPTPWPTPDDDGPTMTPIPDQFQHQPGSTLLQWRVYTPDDGTSGPWPTVVMVHGGAFVSGSPFQPQVERVCEILAKHGFCVFNVCYRLAPCGRIPGQDAHDDSPAGIASGRPPQQTDDLMSIVQAARADSRCKNHKVGVLGVSSGGSLTTYVSLYRGTISGLGRPSWNVNGRDDRPDCAAVFSGVYDLADQIPDDDSKDPTFIAAMQNYVNSCVPSDQRAVSPVTLVNGSTKNSFKPLFLVNSVSDHTVPGRQIFDMQCVLSNAGVNPSDYTVLQIIDEPYDTAHALNLWPAPDPNTGRTVGSDVIAFFHQYLD